MPIHHLPYENGLSLIRGGGNSPLVAKRIFHNDAGSWIEAHQVWRCVSANPTTGVYNWEQFIVTDKYAPKLQPSSPTFTVQAYAPDRHRIIVNWTDPSGYVGYGMYIGWSNYDAEARSDSEYDGSILLPYGRGTTYTIGNAGPSGDHVNIVMYYQDADGFEAPQYTTTVAL